MVRNKSAVVLLLIVSTTLVMGNGLSINSLYYLPMSLDPTGFHPLYPATNGTRLTLCSAMCSQTWLCDMFTYVDGDCTLFFYDAYNSGFGHNPLLPVGNASLYVGLYYSDDFCYVITKTGMVSGAGYVHDFCPRMGTAAGSSWGGKLPEVKTAAESTHLGTIPNQAYGLLAGLNMDNAGVWRWASDNSSAGFSLGSNLTQQCSVFDTTSNYSMRAVGCGGGFYEIACQICP